MAISLVVVLLLLAIIALITQKMITDQLSRMTETVIVTNDILNLALSLPFDISKFDMIRLQHYRDQIDVSVAKIKKKLNYLNSSIHDQYGIAQLAILNGHFKSFFDYIREVEDYLSRGGKDSSSYIQQLNKQLDYIQIYTQQLNIAELHYYSDLKKRLDYHTLQTWLFSILLFAFGGLCLSAIIPYINKTANSVVEISHLAHNMACGNLSVQSIEFNTGDEISVLAQSFNKMAQNLRGFSDNIREYQPMLREHFFRKLAEGKIAASVLPAYLTKLQLEIQGNCIAVIVQIDDYYLATLNLSDEERVNFRNDFSQAIVTIFKDDPTIFIYENNPGELVLCVTDRSQDNLLEKLDLIIDQIRAGLNGKYSVTVAIGNAKESIISFSDSYAEASEALNHKFIIGKNQNIFFCDLEGKFQQQQAFPSLVSRESELIKAIKLTDIKLIEQHLNALIEEIRAHGASAQLYLKMIIGNIYLQALQTLQMAECANEEIFDDPLKVYQKIISHQTIDGMGHELYEVLTGIVDFINIKKGRKYYQVIAKAQEYILQNYARGDLSLEEVANVVHISPCYFSIIFKQEVGMTFVDYVIKVRIEKAKELLTAPGSLTYEVAYQVGYNNPTYFSRLFKKYAGVSPTEFKNQSAKH